MVKSPSLNSNRGKLLGVLPFCLPVPLPIFFRSRIDHMIDLRHPLAVLASRMPWQEIKARVVHVFSRRGRAGVVMPDLNFLNRCNVPLFTAAQDAPVCRGAS